MKDNRFYFLLGWCTAMLVAGFIIGCTVTPLEAHNSDQGSSRYNPLYVVCIEE